MKTYRNKDKAEYARRYLAWRRGEIVGFDLPGCGGPESPDGPAARLSYMAKQAVRMDVNELPEFAGANNE